MSHGAVEHDLAGAEVFGAVDEGDFGGKASEEESLFHGGVAAADDCDLLAGGEEAVAGGAGADAVADEGLLGGEIEPAGARSARDDERAGVDGLMTDAEGDGMRVEIHGIEMGEAEFGTEASGLLLHILDKLRALNAVGPAGEVFDERGDGELAAGLVALEHERLEVRAGRVDGGSESGAAGAEDDGVAGRVFGHMGFPSVNAPEEERIQRQGIGWRYGKSYFGLWNAIAAGR